MRGHVASTRYGGAAVNTLDGRNLACEAGAYRSPRTPDPARERSGHPPEASAVSRSGAVATTLCVAAGDIFRHVVVLVILALVLVSVGTPAALAVGPPADFVPGEVLVELRAGTGLAHIRAVARESNARVTRVVVAPGTPFMHGRSVVLVHTASLSAAQLLAELRADPRVVAVSRNYIRRALDAAPLMWPAWPGGSVSIDPPPWPNDPRFEEQWGLHKVLALEAWGPLHYVHGPVPVIVASIDTGVSYHEDLGLPPVGGTVATSNLWDNPAEGVLADGQDNDGNGYVDDLHGINASLRSGDSTDTSTAGHGTATAGITGAISGNGKGIAGAAGGWRWDDNYVRIMSLNASYNAAGQITDANAVTCISYVLNEISAGVPVVAINASWGGPGSDQVLYDAIESAGVAGVVFVAAAGNEQADNDVTPHYPSGYDLDNIISVAATGPRDELRSSSNFGAVSVDMGAPGEHILSTSRAGGYDFHGGTSMAAPFVTGAVALCAAKYPNESAEQRVARILGNVDPVWSLTGKCTTGGRLNMYKALEGTPPPSDDDIPGVALPASPFSGSLREYSDPDDVFSLTLAKGQSLETTVTGADGIDGYARLYPSSAASHNDPNAQPVAETWLEPGRTWTLTHTAAETGTFYFDFYADASSGSYTVAYTISGPKKSSIDGIRPGSGRRGAVVAIVGTDFGASRAASSVRFGSRRASDYLSWADTRIRCRVPAKAPFGSLKVRVTTAAGTSNAKSFVVKR